MVGKSFLGRGYFIKSICVGSNAKSSLDFLARAFDAINIVAQLEQNQLFFKISITTMDNEIARSVTPIIFFVSKESINTVNRFPFIYVSAKIDV